MLLLKELPSLDLSITDIDISNLKIFFQSRGYTSYLLPEDTIKQISSLFKEELFLHIEGIFLQEILPKFNNFIHKDPRSYAINYLLDLGGDNVTTCFYNNTTEESHVVPLHTWHLFRSDVLHCVKNITTVRKAFTISFKKEIELDTILGLLNESIYPSY
jgi:hypothetical protein